MSKNFHCNAQYYGAFPVEGALSPATLTSLAQEVFGTNKDIRNSTRWSSTKAPQSEKCELRIDEEKLRLFSHRRDEGFESDSECAPSPESLRGSHEIQVANEHVMRLEKLLRKDSGVHGSSSTTSEDTTSCSLSSSSGAESEEEVTLANLRETSKIQGDLGYTESFLMCDILFCHVLSSHPRVVVLVVKSLDSSTCTAHIFECVSVEAARTLYSSYHSASSKYKLSRYRNSHRKSERPSVIQVSIKNHIEPYTNIERQNSSGGESSSSFQSSHYKDDLSYYPKNNVNIIQIQNKKSGAPIERNGITRIEIDSSPCSLPPDMPNNVQYNRYNEGYKPLIPALERLSIHSSKDPDSYLNSIGVTSSCPNSLIVTSREIAAASERERKARQREPPLYIQEEQKKLESINRRQNRRRSQRRNRSKSEERRSVTPTPTFGTEATRASIHGPIRVWTNEEAIIMPHYERQSRARNASRSRDNARARSSHGKRPAPPPPPRRHPDNPSLILVPTKTGQESTKSYYPKESHITRESKIVRIDHPIYPPWNLNPDINNNPQRIYYAPPGWAGSHEYHSSRRNDFYSSEMRKRSRSKSPARRPMGHRYLDAVSTFSLSQKIKDISDTVIQSIRNTPAASHIQSTFNKDDGSRNNGRKGKKGTESNSTEETLKTAMKKNKSNDNRRVTFSSYATVQMMD